MFSSNPGFHFFSFGIFLNLSVLSADVLSPRFEPVYLRRASHHEALIGGGVYLNHSCLMIIILFSSLMTLLFFLNSFESWITNT